MPSTLRATMANLITRTRLMIGDPAGPAQQFADTDVQDALDLSRTDARYLDLLPSPTYSGSTISYLDYFVDQGFGDWEEDGTLWQFRKISVTPATNDWVVGHWTFTLSTLPPVYIIGKTFDLNRSAAELLERWGAALMRNFDFSSDGQSFRRSQAAQGLLNLACHYRKKMRIRNAVAVRADVSDDTGGHDDVGPQEIDYMGSG